MAEGSAFGREYGCTESEWLRWLPNAVREHVLTMAEPGAAEVTSGSGLLRLRWAVLPPRQIALVRLPRLQVSFSIEAVDEASQREFLRYFDLYLQRGGG